MLKGMLTENDVITAVSGELLICGWENDQYFDDPRARRRHRRPKGRSHAVVQAKGATSSRRGHLASVVSSISGT
jgi:hypothetical protein